MIKKLLAAMATAALLQGAQAAETIKLGVVKFPRTGCELLLTQLLGFGSERHDDAVDSLVYLILGVIGDGVEELRPDLQHQQADACVDRRHAGVEACYPRAACQA